MLVRESHVTKRKRNRAYIMNKKISRKRRRARTKVILSKQSNKPRLVAYRSSAHMYCQIVVRGDKGDKVLASATSLGAKLTGTKAEQAAQVGKLLAERAKKLEKKVS